MDNELFDSKHFAVIHFIDSFTGLLQNFNHYNFKALNHWFHSKYKNAVCSVYCECGFKILKAYLNCHSIIVANNSIFFCYLKNTLAPALMFENNCTSGQSHFKLESSIIT